MEIAEHIPQVALALALIVALVLALGFVIKRLNQGGLRQGGGEIKVVASTYLGPKERVLLLEVNERQVLIGVNASGIHALSEFPAAPGFQTTLQQVQSS